MTATTSLRLPCQFARLVALYLIVGMTSLLGGYSCTGSNDQHIDPSSLVLHIEYRSGGDAPLGFIMSFFEDGRIRFLSPRWKVLWSDLSAVEMHHLQDLLGSPEFQRRFELQVKEGPVFGCCDAQEVGIFLGPEARPATVWFDSSKLAPKPLREILEFVDTVGEAHFGRRFSLRLPLQNLEPRDH